MKQTLNGITKTFGALTVDSIAPSEYKEGVLYAQIRQEIETVYPTKRVDNSMQDSLFSVDMFNFAAGETYNSTRVGWIPVPEGTTTEQVAQLLGTKPNARICKKYSNKLIDVLTEEQKYSIAKGQRTAKQFAETLVVKDQNGKVVEPLQYSQGFYVNDFTNHKGSNDTGINIFGDIDVRTVKTIAKATEAEQVEAAGAVAAKLAAEVDAIQ